MAGNGNIDNLIPLDQRTKEEQKKICSQGGKASQKAQKEKKFLSGIYADILAEQADLPKGAGFEATVKAIIQLGGTPAVSMLKEIREATEGNKVNLSGELEIKEIKVTFVEPETK